MPETLPQVAPPTPSADPEGPPAGGVDLGHNTEVWTDLLGPDDLPPPEPDMPTPEVASPPAPAAPQAAPPAAVEAAPQPPVAPAPAEPPTTEVAPAAPPPDGGMLEADWQKRALEALVPAYALDEGLATAYEEDPVKALPQLAARLHLSVVTQMATMLHHAMQNHVPRIILEQIKANNTAMEQRTALETRVFSKYPKLREVSGDAMKTIGGILRKRFPTADFDTGMREAAKMAYHMHGWQFPEEGPAQPPTPTPPPPAQRPYVPVAPGGMTPAPLANGATGGNPFADLIDPR